MGTKVFGLAACLTLASMAGLTAMPTELIIDDFIDSPYNRVLTDHPTFLVEHQTGLNIIGGVRQTSFTASQGTPALGQSTRVQIRPEGPLVVSGGYRSYFGFLLGYGYDASGGTPGLDLDLSGRGYRCWDCDRFRIALDGSDSELSYLMQVYDRDRHIATRAGTESLWGRTEAFHVDFPFDEFVEDPAHPVDWAHIDFVFVLFQTGNTLGGHDFAVTKITAIPEPDAPADPQ